MKYTIFDTETTGLPPKKSNWRTDFMDFPHIVQLAWKRSDCDVIKNYIIKPEGWVIPEESIEIHGITQEYAMEYGIYLITALDYFIHDISDECQLIGHNVHFDTSMIAANALREAPSDITVEILESRLSKEKRICTMFSTIKFCGLKQADSNRAKAPKLTELYQILFNESFPAHDATEDVKATNRCYLELVKLGII